MIENPEKYVYKEWMKKTYSTDLRIKVISHIMSGCRKREAAKIFKIGEATIYRWITLDKAGDIQPKKRTHYPRKVDLEKLVQYVEKHPDHTLKEIGDALGLGFRSVWKWLRHLKITRKKRPRFIKSATKRKDSTLKSSLKK
jgi:putative transposase